MHNCGDVTWGKRSSSTVLREFNVWDGKNADQPELRKGKNKPPTLNEAKRTDMTKTICNITWPKVLLSSGITLAKWAPHSFVFMPSFP